MINIDKLGTGAIGVQIEPASNPKTNFKRSRREARRAPDQLLPR
jgi:hypothetical protein